MASALHADYHVHTNYSDGSFLDWMVEAAAEVELDGVGIADHCMLTDDVELLHHRHVAGYNLDLTYRRRRQAIQRVAEERGIEVYDAVEMDYLPGSEDRIAAFLDEAAFDYAIGSVHLVDGANVHFSDHFADQPLAERRRAVEGYFDDLEAMIRSELFDIAAHPDIVERNEALRGLASEAHYHRIAAAFEASRTVPELNAGRIDAAYGRFHPNGAFLEVLREHDLPFTVGSDAHEPAAIERRVPRLRAAFDEWELPRADPLEG